MPGRTFRDAERVEMQKSIIFLILTDILVSFLFINRVTEIQLTENEMSPLVLFPLPPRVKFASSI
jgi:hypothetical protein